MQILNRAQFETLVQVNPLAAILFDVAWDNHRGLILSKMFNAEEILGDRAFFGEVDCDADFELSREIGVVNVPMVVFYFRAGTIAERVIGAGQDVQRILEDLAAEGLAVDVPGAAIPRRVIAASEMGARKYRDRRLAERPI